MMMKSRVCMYVARFTRPLSAYLPFAHHGADISFPPSCMIASQQPVNPEAVAEPALVAEEEVQEEAVGTAAIPDISFDELVRGRDLSTIT